MKIKAILVSLCMMYCAAVLPALASLYKTGVTPGTYTLPTLQIDAFGRVLTASSSQPTSPIDILGNKRTITVLPGDTFSSTVFISMDGMQNDYSGVSTKGVLFDSHYTTQQKLAAGGGSEFTMLYSVHPVTIAGAGPFYRMHGGVDRLSGYVCLYYGAMADTIGLFDIVFNTTYLANSAFFRFSPDLGDTTIKATTCDGTTSTVIDTGVTPAINHIYTSDIDFTTSGHVKFSIDGVQVADSTTHLPASSTNLGYRQTFLHHISTAPVDASDASQYVGVLTIQSN